MEKRLELFKQLLEIMDELREKCPWDREQTIESLRHLTIEETYELADAILAEDYNDISKELGDLLLHIVFYAKIGEEKNLFDIATVIEGINQKLIRRHPHIFGDIKVENANEVKENWEKIKLQEGRDSVLEGVPNSLPAMIKAYRIQDKARGIGFDWETTEQVWNKVQEEKHEFEAELQKENNLKRTEEEFGDLLFALVNYSRFININPENALEKANQKFIKRFTLMEKDIKNDSKSMHNMTLDEMDVYWEKAKEKLSKS